MDSDLIRQEIDRTVQRIDDDLQLLAERTRRAARTAGRWMLVAAGAATAITVVAIWRYRSSRRRRIESHAERAASPLRAVRVPGRHAESRTTAELRMRAWCRSSTCPP